MMDDKNKPQNIDDYIVNFSPEVQVILQELSALIQQEAPKAKETISYQMPTFTLHGNLVHFAAYQHHIGFYPTPSGVTAFADQLSQYKTSKGAVQFPLDKPLPFDLIRKMVAYRVAENEAKAAAKTAGKKKKSK